MLKNLETIGDRLKKVAKEQFGSLTAMSTELKMKPQSLYTYTSNESKPGADFQEKLRGIGVDVEYIMTGRPSSNENAEQMRKVIEAQQVTIYTLSSEVKVLREALDYYRSQGMAHAINDVQKLETEDSESNTITHIGKAAATPISQKSG